MSSHYDGDTDASTPSATATHFSKRGRGRPRKYPRSEDSDGGKTPVHRESRGRKRSVCELEVILYFDF